MPRIAAFYHNEETTGFKPNQNQLKILFMSAELLDIVLEF
jgi:hypothetical protein